MQVWADGMMAVSLTEWPECPGEFSFVWQKVLSIDQFGSKCYQLQENASQPAKNSGAGSVNDERVADVDNCCEILGKQLLQDSWLGEPGR
jgi:hypothetical protein